MYPHYCVLKTATSNDRFFQMNSSMHLLPWYHGNCKSPCHLLLSQWIWPWGFKLRCRVRILQCYSDKKKTGQQLFSYPLRSILKRNLQEVLTDSKKKFIYIFLWPYAKRAISLKFGWPSILRKDQIPKIKNCTEAE